MTDKSLSFAVAFLLLSGAFAAVPCATNAWPAAVAPVCRDFSVKCAAGTATRGDLIALKRFIAASAIDGAAKSNVTQRVRKLYHGRRKKTEGGK